MELGNAGWRSLQRYPLVLSRPIDNTHDKRTMAFSTLHQVDEFGRSEVTTALTLLYGESRGSWKYHVPDKKFRQAKTTGKINNQKDTLLFDSGAEVSILDAAFARKVGCYIDNSQELACEGVGENPYMANGRTRVKLTLAGPLVCYFDVWVGPPTGGQDLGLDFMMSAGVRLDLANGSLSLPDWIRIQLAGRRPLYGEKVSQVRPEDTKPIVAQVSGAPPDEAKPERRPELVGRAGQWDRPIASDSASEDAGNVHEVRPDLRRRCEKRDGDLAGSDGHDGRSHDRRQPSRRSHREYRGRDIAPAPGHLETTSPLDGYVKCPTDSSRWCRLRYRCRRNSSRGAASTADRSTIPREKAIGPDQEFAVGDDDHSIHISVGVPDRGHLQEEWDGYTALYRLQTGEQLNAIDGVSHADD
ncbi:unnamed protein product [Phytophthora fragariaefolia]|uniref:Unnamed protein product n=1 Tax=Phytophthora fragariaefolia TaxID=1490495 RepID=A0A9W7CXD3_9STRA|nr:unnamed protein product [Phytophthora fragariaefolia]